MDLHRIVSGGIGQVNPFLPGVILVSQGSTIAADGSMTPAYAAPVTVPMQVQALTQGDLRMLEGLNIQGSQKSIYVRGQVLGLVRQTNRGGDVITLAGDVWLVTAVLESWPDWCKVSVTLQNGS